MVYRLMRDETQSKFSLDYIKKWLNDAEREYCNRTEYGVKKSTATSTTPTQREYPIPTDAKLIRTLYYNGNKLGGPIDIEDTIHEGGDESGTPTAYYVELDKIGLEPIPVEVKTLTIIYYSLGGAMSSASDAPIIPQEHHMLLVYRACYYACVEAEDDRLNVFYGEWVKGLSDALIDNMKKNPWPQIDLGERLEVSRYNHDVGEI
jgi:hypothetical protein